MTIAVDYNIFVQEINGETEEYVGTRINDKENFPRVRIPQGTEDMGTFFFDENNNFRRVKGRGPKTPEEVAQCIYRQMMHFDPTEDEVNLRIWGDEKLPGGNWPLSGLYRHETFKEISTYNKLEAQEATRISGLVEKLLKGEIKFS